MKNKIIVFSKENPSKKYFNLLSKEENEMMKSFEKEISVMASKSRVEECIKDIIRFRATIEKSLKNLKLDDINDFARIINNSSLADNTKNNIRTNTSRFLKFHYKDWSDRFRELKQLKLDTEPKPLNTKTKKNIIPKKEISLLIKSSQSLLYKTLIAVHGETGARTGELTNKKRKGNIKKIYPVRWEDVKFKSINGTEVALMTFYSIKNKKGKIKSRTWTLINSVYYLKELKKEVELNLGNNFSEKLFVFASPRSKKNAISSSIYQQMFSKLTLKVLGRKEEPYIFRKSKVTEFDEKVKRGDMTEEVALYLLGHGKKMFHDVYSKLTEEDMINIAGEQYIGDDYIPEEKKNEYDEKIESLEKDMEEIKKQNKKLLKFINSL